MSEIDGEKRSGTSEGSGGDPGSTGSTGYRGAAQRTRASGTGTGGSSEASRSSTGSGGSGSSLDDTHKLYSERVRKLGEGSYGEVWLVQYLGALEAHKYLRPGSRKEAFREAVNTRSVDHPHVVKVVDVIEEGDLPVLRMEFVEGRDLKNFVEEEGIFSVERILPIAIQIADALRATHERGIVHLDLKPSNMILRDDGKNVVVTDFGISAALRPEDGATQEGQRGTPYFMAPELHGDQGRGSPLSDIWSLGISLYYLVSGTYPFPFDTISFQEAVLEEPKDLSAHHRCVSPRFWGLLRKMISVDPEGRHGSMKAVKQSLEDYASSLICPACGQLARFESISEVCPNPDCQSPLVAPLKSAIVARRSAYTALSESSFDDSEALGLEAREEFDKIDGCGEQVQELDAFLHAIPGLRQDHDGAVASGRDLFETEKYIDGLHRIHAATRLYSHSAEVKSLRLEMRTRFATLYRSTPDQVRQRIRNREFEAARAELSRMDHILGDEIARKELAAGIDEDLRDFAWLHDEINQQQKDYQKYRAAAGEAILAFDFLGAMEAWTRLDTAFPSEESQSSLAALGRAGRLHEQQARFSPESLQAIIAQPAEAGKADHLRLEEGADACRRLLEDFPPDTYPTFAQIQEKSLLLDQAAAALRAYVQEILALAETARNSQNLLEENRQLKMVKEILSRSDLFDSRTMGMVDDRLRATDRSVDESDRLYSEGKQAFEAREFSKSLASLREVARIAPGSYPDVEELLAGIEKNLDEVRTLKGEVSERLALIDRGDFDLPLAIDTLQKTEKLYGLVELRERSKLHSELAVGCARLFDDQADYLAKEFSLSDDRRGLRIAEFLSGNTIPLLDALNQELWESLLGESKECNRSLCEFFAAIQPDGKLDFESWIAQVDPLLGVMEESVLTRILSVCTPPQGAEHPSVAWGGMLLEAYRREPLAKKDLHFANAGKILDQLVAFCPPTLHHQVSGIRNDLKKGGRQATLFSRLYRARDFARTNLWVCVAAVVAGIICYWLGKGAGESQSFSWIDEEVARLELSSEPLTAALSDWIQEGGQEKNVVTRIQLLIAWQNLISARDKGIKGSLLASLVGNAVLNRPILSARAKELRTKKHDVAELFARLEESFDSEISRNTWLVLDDLLRETHTTLSGDLHGGEGVVALLCLRLEVLYRLVEIKDLDDLRIWLVGIVNDVDDRIRIPLGEANRWEEFRPDDVLGKLALLPVHLTREGGRDLDMAVGQIVKLEIRRAMIQGLKHAVDRALDGNLEGFSQVVATVGRELEHLGGLGPIDPKGTSGTLAEAVRWVNEFEAAF